MAGRNLRNRSITSVDGGRSSNEVDEYSSLGNTTLNREAETEGTVMSEYEGNNSDSTVTTETSVGMTTEQCYYYFEGRHCNNDRNKQLKIPNIVFKSKIKFF
jgi:hypothetical protein